jgi:cathepsin X
MKQSIVLFALNCFFAYAYRSEVIGKLIKTPVILLSPDVLGDVIPDEFNWCNQNENNYCVSSINQHIPQYCGSCWNAAATMALNDRIKFLRKGVYPDIRVSMQHVLNCIDGASCYGGQVDSVYDWMLNNKIELSYDDAMPYVACSSDSTEGFCKNVDTTCKPLNIARTCGSFNSESGPCVGLGFYPNVTISNYGTIAGRTSMMNELVRGGPIACGIDAMPLLNYKGGIINEQGNSIDHVVEVIGFNNNEKYWIIRNSWGSYWGEFSFARIGFGSLMLEEQCTWATIGTFSSPENNNLHPCSEGGDCS